MGLELNFSLHPNFKKWAMINTLPSIASALVLITSFTWSIGLFEAMMRRIYSVMPLFWCYQGYCFYQAALAEGKTVK